MSLKEKVIEHIEKKWSQGVVQQNAEALLSLYVSNALLKPTLSNSIREGHDNIKEYFVGGDKFQDKGFLNNAFKQVLYKESFFSIQENFAVYCGIYEFINENKERTPAHFSFTLKEVEGQLYIIAHHSSLLI